MISALLMEIFKFSSKWSEICFYNLLTYMIKVESIFGLGSRFFEYVPVRQYMQDLF